ncbi:MAG: hypothetical protein FJ098_05330 [Deltaproteobacteria bacterium]|nr:hypothetical protein [Deltaproteobacteria bacterium]
MDTQARRIAAVLVLVVCGCDGAGAGEACRNGTYRCNGRNVERCEDGAGWVHLFTCAAAIACTDRGCPAPDPGGCQPDCAGRACGDDGCGASCGVCSGGEVCDLGACVSGEGGTGPCGVPEDPWETWAWQDLSGDSDHQTGAYTVWWFDDPCAAPGDPVEGTLHAADDVDWYRWNLAASQAGCGVAPRLQAGAGAAGLRLRFFARCYWGEPSWTPGPTAPPDQACVLLGEGSARCEATGSIALADLRCPGQDVGDGLSETSMEAFVEVTWGSAAGTCGAAAYTLDFDF